jgi:glycerol-3-phosphate O-acyltransferase
LHAFVECGLLTTTPDELLWQRPPAGSESAVQLSILAATALPIIERYYLTIHVILTAGSAGITADGLETRCQLLATRIASLYELRAPEFFDKALYRQFLDLLRERQAVSLTDSGCLVANNLLREVSWDAQKVLSEQIRGSILQVTRIHNG